MVVRSIESRRGNPSSAVDKAKIILGSGSALSIGPSSHQINSELEKCEELNLLGSHALHIPQTDFESHSPPYHYPWSNLE